MRHHVEGHAFVWHCRDCGNEQREDVEPYDEDCWGGCRRVYYFCNNVDCKSGPMARWLREQLRKDRCHMCKSVGVIVTMDGDEMPCPVDECLAAELLLKDYAAERIFSPSYHRDGMGITYTLPGRVDPMGENKVVNRHHREPDGGPIKMGPGCVYIGRGSLFGNPFTHQNLATTGAVVKVDTREEAVESFRLWMTSDLEIPEWTKPTREQVISLYGKTLACWCAPKPCHGDVLLELAAAWRAEAEASR